MQTVLDRLDAQARRQPGIWAVDDDGLFLLAVLYLVDGQGRPVEKHAILGNPMRYHLVRGRSDRHAVGGFAGIAQARAFLAANPGERLAKDRRAFGSGFDRVLADRLAPLGEGAKARQRERAVVEARERRQRQSFEARRRKHLERVARTERGEAAGLAVSVIPRSESKLV